MIRVPCVPFTVTAGGIRLVPVAESAMPRLAIMAVVALRFAPATIHGHFAVGRRSGIAVNGFSTSNRPQKNAEKLPGPQPPS